MKITFLGTGTSTGVPQTGCTCEVCTSHDPRDARLRSSILVETGEANLLIDCGPDFRQQMLHRYMRLDGVLVTHEHYDHVGGIDDLRPFCAFGDIQIYAEKNVCTAIRTRLPYCFYEERYPGIPVIELNAITLEPFFVNGVKIIPLRLMHGRLPIVGYRIGDMAYLTDMLTMPDSEYAKLTGLKALIIDALRIEPHNSHQHLAAAVDNIRRIAPQHAYLIHMSHQIGLHAQTQQSLPEDITLSWDGLQIEI